MDRKLNDHICRVLKQGRWEVTTWQKLLVGQIIKVDSPNKH